MQAAGAEGAQKAFHPARTTGAGHPPGGRSPSGLTPGYLGGELGPRGNVQLGEYVSEMCLHGPVRDVHALTDLGIGQPLSDQAGHGLLGGGEAGPAELRPAAGTPAAAPDPCLAQRRLGPREITGGAEALVHAVRPRRPPHRHTGPVFGYMLEGEMTFELEGEPERVIGAGEAFWEPGGDVIHYQAANHLQDAWTRFVVVMLGIPGKPMLTLVPEAELE